MRKMATWVSAVALVTVAAGVFAPGGALLAGEEGEIGKMIASAKTAADHEAIAAEYEKGATAAKADSERHTAMAEAYKKVGGALIEKQHLDTHCAGLAKLYAKIAKENETLAKAHRAMAKDAK